MSPKLSVRSARKTFTQAKGASVCAIADLSFEMAAGEWVAVVGPTGAGKSVLLDCLLDLKQLDSGDIRIEVCDEDRSIPTSRNPRDDDAGGRGLRVVSALAHEWGVEQTSTGKVVWARFVADRS